MIFKSFRRPFDRVPAAAALALSLVATAAPAAGLAGAGGGAIYPLLSRWADQYAKETGDTINYQAVGSGGTILQQMKSKTILFANTDIPLSPADVARNNLVQFPIVIISIAPVVNLKGIKPGELVFDGPTLANIYLGNVKEWDDPAIRKLNPGVNLPHQAITTVHRSDGSGTTFNFTDYLSKVSAEWKSKVGEGASINWPNGVGGKGNPGVASHVQQVDGAIGYVEFAYVMEYHLTYTNMINKSGKTIAPTMEAFQVAVANADFTKVKDFYAILTDQPGEESWPITAATYMLLRRDTAPDQNQLALKFFDWCLKKGQDQAKALDYVPLSDPIIRQIEEHWADELKGADGNPIWKVVAAP